MQRPTGTSWSTGLSGRSVGLDVVKRNIEALRSQIALTSIERQGTRTQIHLPLTLAMIDGFLTLVGGCTMCCRWVW